MSDSLPTLWQIEISHYSEKARWALAYKGVEHRRRAPLPGAHMPVALWLTRGEQKTFPILTLDGRNIGDSTAIIAALEERFPEPPLYPADPEQRRRALELEDFFDEELGPHVRLLAFHEMRKDPDRLRDDRRRGGARPARPAAWPRPTPAPTPACAGSRATRRRPRSTAPRSSPPSTASRRSSARGDYLVGEAFSVADLTAASLLYPVVAPRRGAVRRRGPPKGMRRFREPLSERAGFKWVEEMFAPPPQAGEGRRGRLTARPTA